MWPITIFFISIALGVCSCEYDVSQAMENEKIVPEVIPVAPKGMVQVRYPSGVKAELGNELTPTQVKDEPFVNWDADPHSFYTLCLTDPDASNRSTPKGNEPYEFDHWLVGNIPGENLSMGETLTAYIGSGPPPNSGLHRYVFLVYQQPFKLSFDESHISNRTAEKRAKFSINKFALKYNLGAPVAGNFYQAQYDDYVPILHKQLGAK